MAKYDKEQNSEDMLKLAEESTRSDAADIAELNETINWYLKTIGEMSRLSADEEIRLSALVKKGKEAKEKKNSIHTLSKEEIKELDVAIEEGREARNRLASTCYLQVVSIAKNLRWTGVPMMDMIQEGNIGLLEAAERYDPMTNKTRFVTYANFWARKMIRTAAKNNSLINSSNSFLRKCKKARAAQERLTVELKREPSLFEIAEEAKIHPSEIKQCLDGMKGAISMNTSEIPDTEKKLEDILPDKNAMDPLDVVEFDDIAQNLKNTIYELLTKEEQVLISMKFGFDGNLPMSHEEIGKVLGMTREEVWSNANYALVKIRRKGDFYEKKLRECAKSYFG